MRFILLLLAFTFFSCGQTTESESTAELDTPTSLPQDFRDFYQRFHTDSLYQLAHIQWPLSGIPDKPIPEGETFVFTQENWRMQRPIPVSSGYSSRFSLLTEDIIVEEIVNPSDGTGLMRRFLRDNNDWRLIYYQGVRKLQ